MADDTIAETGTNKDTNVTTQTFSKVKRPGKWKVVLHNNPGSNGEWIVMNPLLRIFKKNKIDALAIIKKANEEGKADVASFSREIAVSKVNDSKSMAKHAGQILDITAVAS